MQVNRIATVVARSRHFGRTYYKEWAKIALYLVNKYGVASEADIDLCSQILNRDSEVKRLAKESCILLSITDVNDIITHYEWSIDEQQKANRELIKGE